MCGTCCTDLPARVFGDPHFSCPGSDRTFDFDGHQSLNKPDFYRYFYDEVTRLGINLRLSTVKVAPHPDFSKLFTHVSGVFISEPTVPAIKLTTDKHDAFPTLVIDGQHISLQDKLGEIVQSPKVHVSIDRKSCNFMQPRKFLYAILTEKAYTYAQTEHPCTYISVSVSDHLSLKVVHVPAGVEKDSVVS